MTLYWATCCSACVHLLLVVLLPTQNRFQSVSCFMECLKVQLCIFHPQHKANTLYWHVWLLRNTQCNDGKIQTHVFMSLNHFVCFCRDSVYYWSFHQLCGRCGATHTSQSETLDQTGSCSHLCTGLLNKDTHFFIDKKITHLSFCFIAHDDCSCGCRMRHFLVHFMSQ